MTCLGTPTQWSDILATASRCSGLSPIQAAQQAWLGAIGVLVVVAVVSLVVAVAYWRAA